MIKLLKNRSFALLWAGQMISRAGSWINFVGLNLYVLKIFGSGTVLGGFLVVRMLPSVLFGSIGGYLADKFNKKKLMILCDFLRALIVLGFMFTKNLYVFYVLGLLLSALDKVFISARSSFIPEIVSKEHIMEANSFSAMTASIMTVLGPAIGALMVSLLNYRIIFIADSVTFIFSVLFLINILYSPSKIIKKRNIGITEEFIEEYRTTFAFLKGHSSMLFLLLLRFIDAIGSGAYNIALPIYSKIFLSFKIFSSSITFKKGAVFGWLVGAWAMGNFFGSYFTKKVMKVSKISRENIFSISIALMALGMGMTFHFKDSLWAFFAIFIGGVGDGMSNVIFMTMLMKESPAKIRGKVLGTVLSLITTAVAVGMMLGGWFIDKYEPLYITNFASILIFIGVILGRIFFIKRKVKE